MTTALWAGRVSIILFARNFRIWFISLHTVGLSEKNPTSNVKDTLVLEIREEKLPLEWREAKVQILIKSQYEFYSLERTLNGYTHFTVLMINWGMHFFSKFIFEPDF